MSAFRSRWDKFLDWWEFDLLRVVRAQAPALVVIALFALAIALLLAVLLISMPARANDESFVIVPVALIERAIARIDELEAEVKKLRARCPPGVQATGL